MRRSGIFLIELILALLVFSMTSALCMQIFAYSSTLTKNREQQDKAVSAVVCAAECLKASGGDLTLTSEKLGENASVQNGVLSQKISDTLTLTLEKENEDPYSVACLAVVWDETGKEIHALHIAALKFEEDAQ